MKRAIAKVPNAAGDGSRQRAQLDRAAIDDIQLALHQSQPLSHARFHDKIEKMTGIRREAKRRGRPRLARK